MAREDVMQALADAEAVLWMNGGGLTVITDRVRADDLLVDGMPGEAFTRAVIVEWRDRTDARQSPERTVPIHSEPQPEPTQPEPAEPAGRAADASDLDGLVIDAADDEDMSAIPPALR